MGPVELIAYRKGMAEHFYHSDSDIKQPGPLISSDSTVSNWEAPVGFQKDNVIKSSHWTTGSLHSSRISGLLREVRTLYRRPGCVSTAYRRDRDPSMFVRKTMGTVSIDWM